MKRTWKQIGSLFLVLCMVVTVLPMTALAEAGDDDELSLQDTLAATVTESVYGSVSGTMDIGGETDVRLDVNTDKRDKSGWAWDAATATLTLYSNYGCSYIHIDCDEADTVNLEYNGDVSLKVIGSSDDDYETIYCEGSLIINGSGGTLKLTNNSDMYNTLETGGALTFSSGAVSISGSNSAVYASGDITVDAEATADVTSAKYGLYSDGSLYLSGALTATGGSFDYAVNVSSVFVTGGTLNTTANYGYIGDVSGDIAVSGGNVNILGDVSGDVTVSAGTVEIQGDVDGSLAVFNGTVNITGMVSGSINVIGGTVEVDGEEVTEVLNPTLVLDASQTGANPFRLAAVTGPAADSVSGYTWNGADKELTLSGFNYTSDAATALKIVNGAVEIVLAPALENTIVSSYSGSNMTFGIETEYDITFSGSGSLTIESGTSTSNDSYGIGSNSKITISGGRITAIGGNGVTSSGIGSRGLSISGGRLTATGGTESSMSFGAHIQYGEIGGNIFSGGTLVLSGNSNAYYFRPNIQLTALTYTWWANTNNSDPGGIGTDGSVAPFTVESMSNYKFVKLSVPIFYPVIVNNGTTSKSTAMQGETVSILANAPDPGMRFKEWTVQSGNIVLDDPQASRTSFTMPEGEVEVTATHEAIPYLMVLDVSVTDANKDSITGQGISGDVSYDPVTGTLTLNNAVITSSTLVDTAIWSEDDLTVRLVGQNRIGTAPGNPANKANYNVGIGIISGKSLFLTGDGSLTIYDSITGIDGVDNLTIDIGGSLTVVEYGNEGSACCLRANGVLTIERGNLNLTSYNSKGLKGDSIVINGGVITAQTQGVSGHYAFSTEPSFGEAYDDDYQVFAGENADSSDEVPSPVAATYTASKYVRIQPDGAQIYTITFNTNGGNALSPGTLTTGADGRLSVLPVPTRSSSYRFDGWYTAASGGTVVTASTVFTADTTIYAHWTYTGGGSGGNGGGSSSGGSTTTPTPPPATPPVTPTPSNTGSTATTTVTTTTGTDGKAAASVPASQVGNALKQAQAAAAGSGEAPRVEIKVEAPADAKAVETKVPQAAMAAMASGNLQEMTISSPVASLAFDGAVLNTITGAASGDVSFSASKVDTASLPASVRTLIGDRPVYEFSVTSGGNTISQFNGNVTVAVPYRLGAGEDPNAVIISFINAGGNLEIVANGRYDAATGTVVFTTDHFSRYAIGYNKLAFSDVAASAWYADAVTFLAARGITDDITAENFSPNAKLTRGQFITMLLKAFGIEPMATPTDNFADAGSTYYTGYLAAAKVKGIAGGVGNNKFAPENAITRQEMFTLLYNALKVLNKLPSTDSGKTLSDFTDSSEVADWATEAMTALVKSGTVSGSGSKLEPTEGSTRAQMAQLLYNLLGK